MHADAPLNRTKVAATGAAAALLCVVLVLARGGGGGPWWQPASLYHAPGSAAPKPQRHGGPGRCLRWASTHVIGGGCLAEFDAGPEGLPCCGGRDYRCKRCPPDTLAALRCLNPRHTLLLPQPGCSLGAAAGRAAALQPLTADAVRRGRWVNASEVPGGDAAGTPPLLFVPGTGPRRVPPLTAGEALGRMWGAGLDRVVVSGDSTVRHLYNRLVSVLREQPSTIDGGGIAHAHWRLAAWGGNGADDGAEGSGSGVGTGASDGSPPSGVLYSDELWVSPAANMVKGSWDEELMGDGLEALLRRSFGGGGSGGGGGGEGEGEGDGEGRGPGSSLTLDFVVGAKATWQQQHVRRYLAAGGPRGSAADWRRRTLLVLSLCVWEQTQVFRSGWLEFLEEVRQQVGQLALLTCPTDRIRRPNQAAGRVLVAERNERLRGMVAAGLGGSAPRRRRGAAAPGPAPGGGGGSAAAGRPLLLVDLDGVTARLPPGSGLAVAPTDYHYQCMLGSSTSYNGTGPIAFLGGDAAPPHAPAMRYDRLLVPPAATCADPVNFAGWELLLRLLPPRA